MGIATSASTGREYTKQEAFWRGEFGNRYVDRNGEYETQLPRRLRFFSRALRAMDRGLTAEGGAIEFGANIGLNLIALHMLFPHARLAGVEINDKAAESLRALEFVEAFHQSVYDFAPTPSHSQTPTGRDNRWELTLSCGVLIHQPPEMLPRFYDLLHRHSSRYILVSEYYNPTPVTVNYRGNDDVLFKRDFAGEMLDAYADLRLVDYGFFYHRDALCPLDDPTWFLLQKAGD